MTQWTRNTPGYCTKQEAKQKRNLKKRGLIPQYGRAGLKKGKDDQMKNRKASDRLAECVIDMVHAYKMRVGELEYRNSVLQKANEDLKKQREKAVVQADNATDTLGEIADIIAGITEHDKDGYTKIYLSDLMRENESKLKRLFKLLDIPMTAEQIKKQIILTALSESKNCRI